MKKNIKKYTLSIGIVFVSLFFLSQVSSAQPYACIPTCSEVDAEFLLFAQGDSLQTINNQDLEVQIRSAEGSPTFEIGIFDGDALQFGDFSHWDKTQGRPPVVLLFKLFLDPEGSGQGNGVSIATWSSDGSIGDNLGDPMPDNEWFVRELLNSPIAQTANGFFSYKLVVSVLNPDPNPAGESLNPFKLRTDGIISITAGSAFNYMAPLENFFDIITIYPEIDFLDPGCLGPPNGMGGYCDPDDPSCCLFNSPYDGAWKFCMIVPGGISTLDIWDGDFDFGSSSGDPNPPFACNFANGLFVDTNDQNTPLALPPWSAGTDVVTQGVSTPTAPPDDFGCLALNLRTPSVNYDLIGPGGVTYTNVNPSGNLEWELFNISTEPFNPDLYDIHVDAIEPGLWCVEPFGNDIRNLNSLRLPYDMFGLDENGDPVLPDVPLPPAEVPTLSEWGLMSLALMGLLVSIFYLRNRKKMAAGKN